MNNQIHNTFLLTVILLITACSKDEEVSTPPKDHEEEVITSMIISFEDSARVHPAYTASFRDVDGIGGNEPVQFDTIRLQSGSTYFAKIVLLNETENPADSISNEVLEEADEHLFCFEPISSDVEIQRIDSDGQYEVGLTSKWTTGASGNGNVKVTLKHQPDGEKNGSCEPGETDVEVNFRLEIE